MLDEEMFQRLLAAAHILQQCNDHRGKELNFSNVALSGRGGVNLNVLVPSVDVPDLQAHFPIKFCPSAQADVQPSALQNHLLIPLETAHQFSILASQLEALVQKENPTESQRTQLSASAVEERPAQEQHDTVDQAGDREKVAFEQLQSESVRLTSPDHLSGMSNLPHRIVHRLIPKGSEFFWSTATALTLAAVLFLLLGASVHRLSPLPGGMTLSSNVAQQQPFHRITAEKPVATKRIETPPVSEHVPAQVENSDSSGKRVVKSSSTRSTHDNELSDENEHRIGDESVRIASEVENRIHADRRLHMTRVQVRTSNGIVTLSGDVGSEAERLAAAQDATHIRGIEALVNNLKVITNSQSPESSASVIPSTRAPAVERSTVEAVNRSTPHVSTVLSNTHPTDSKILAPSGNASPVSISATKTPVNETEQVIVPEGTLLAVRLSETLSSDLNQAGDTFLAGLASPIVVGDRVIVPEGADVKGKILDARKAGRFGGRSALAIKVTQLVYNGRAYELRSNPYSEQGASRNEYAAAAITGGTGVGAIIGSVVGKGRGAAIGAVIGAAAGTGVQAVTKRAPAQLRAESTLSFRLETSLKVIPSSALNRGQSVAPSYSREPFSSNDGPVLKHRVGSQLPDTNANVPDARRTSNKDSQQAPSPR